MPDQPPPPHADTPTLPPAFPSEMPTQAPTDPDATAPRLGEGPAGAVRSVPESGLAVPGYEILGELGRGGMGVVYRARQVAAKRIVALKMVLSGSHAGLLELQRFRTEAEAAARMQHPNLVHICEVGEHDGLPYFSMELVDGDSLASKLTGQPWPEIEAAQLIETLARAMDYAHRQGVIHRDLKPANVLLAADSTPKITDFGLAKMVEEQGRGQTRTGTVMGTPSYMAPEQAGGWTQAIGPATDVWALGAILYELLTGRPPFRGATDLDTVLAVISEDAVPVRQVNRKVSRDLETICLKCLQKERGKRYTSAAALGDDLQRFVNGEPIKARSPQVWERATRWIWRWPASAVSLILAGPILLLLVAGPFTPASVRQFAVPLFFVVGAIAVGPAVFFNRVLNANAGVCIASSFIGSLLGFFAVLFALQLTRMYTDLRLPEAVHSVIAFGGIATGATLGSLRGAIASRPRSISARALETVAEGPLAPEARARGRG